MGKGVVSRLQVLFLGTLTLVLLLESAFDGLNVLLSIWSLFL